MEDLSLESALFAIRCHVPRTVQGRWSTLLDKRVSSDESENHLDRFCPSSLGAGAGQFPGLNKIERYRFLGSRCTSLTRP